MQANAAVILTCTCPARDVSVDVIDDVIDAVTVDVVRLSTVFRGAVSDVGEPRIGGDGVADTPHCRLLHVRLGQWDALLHRQVPPSLGRY